MSKTFYIKTKFIPFFFSWIITLFVTSNHQTTNIVFPPIFSTKFSQLEQLKKKTDFLLVQNRFFFQVGTNEKFVFFFNCLNWEKSVEKVGENKILGLVFWCREQDIISYSSFEQPIRIPNFCNDYFVYLLFLYFCKVKVLN